MSFSYLGLEGQNKIFYLPKLNFIKATKMLSQMSRKKAIWGNQESKQPVCMCNITIAVHTVTSFYLNLLSSGICTQLLCSLRHRQSKSHRQMDYIDFSILILVNKSSCNTGNFLGKSTKKNASQNFLTPQKSQNYWFQTPKNLKFGLALDAGIYVKRDLWGTAIVRSLMYFFLNFQFFFCYFLSHLTVGQMRYTSLEALLLM